MIHWRILEALLDFRVWATFMCNAACLYCQAEPHRNPFSVRAGRLAKRLQIGEVGLKV